MFSAGDSAVNRFTSHADRRPWVAQTLLQLVLLSIIMVGQNVQAAAADKRAEATLHEVAHVQGHLAAQDELLSRIARRSVLTRCHSSTPHPTKRPRPMTRPSDRPTPQRACAAKNCQMTAVASSAVDGGSVCRSRCASRLGVEPGHWWPAGDRDEFHRPSGRAAGHGGGDGPGGGHGRCFAQALVPRLAPARVDGRDGGAVDVRRRQRVCVWPS